MTPDREDADGDRDDDRDGPPAESGAGPADGDADGEDPFERLPDADDRNPFESLPADDAERADEDLFEEVETDPLSEVEADAGEAAEAVVPKSRYCESCEYFDEPPEIRCTHPGTEIRELVDLDHFRVFGCPVVADRQETSEIVARDIETTVGADGGTDGD